MSKLLTETTKQTHFFACDYFGWVTAETRTAAIKKLLLNSSTKSDISKAHKIGLPGKWVWTCEVTGSPDSKYIIENFRPVGIPCFREQTHYITHYSKLETAWLDTTDGLKHRPGFKCVPLKELN